jgi:hypothetical protein
MVGFGKDVGHSDLGGNAPLNVQDLPARPCGAFIENVPGAGANHSAALGELLCQYRLH